MTDTTPKEHSEPTLETRYQCPVCFGVKLSKIPVDTAKSPATKGLMLDRCTRCGGIWFDEGEVAQLRSYRLEGVRHRIRPSEAAFRMPCHSCQTLMERDAEKCAFCGWVNVLDCPVCSRPMKRQKVQDWHLDACMACRGVWFDQIELVGIWNLHAQPAAGQSNDAGWTAVDAVEVGLEVVDIVAWSPDLVVTGARAVGHGVRSVATGGAQVVGEVPAVLGGAVEAAGELAGGVFEALADIVGAVFS